ncbi:MAG: hypothetical protein MJ252_00335 [archaeon]|nr:hypothetical protein [archaeon]
MFEAKGSQNKSLSADSELDSAYDLLNHGEYNQCARKIRKKLPKLKNPVDIANFEILKLLLLQRTKKVKEKNELLEKLKKDFLTIKELYENDSLSKYFKNILGNFNEDKAIYEIFKVQNKGKSFDNLTFEKQCDILRELCQNFEFGDAYSKINIFLKTPGDNNDFLKLMRYECIYYLFKNKKFSENMLKKFGAELESKIEELKGEKGFYDILGQYLIALKNKQKLIEIFTTQKKPEDPTNVPFEDLKLEIMYEDNKLFEILNELYEKIKSNPEEFIFNTYERIINVFFHYLKENNVKLNLDNLINGKNDVAEKLSPIDKPENIFMEIYNLLEHIKENHQKNFNSFKSAVLGQLMLYHNAIILSSTFPEGVHKNILSIINLGLEKCSQKPSFLLEIQKFFIYLNEADRKEILEKYSSKVDLKSFEGITMENINDYIFYFKLYKILTTLDDTQLFELFNNLLNLYLMSLEKIIGNYRPAKGERIISDDLIILLNELYYENESKFQNKHLAMILYIDSLAHNHSCYNYDINYYLFKAYGQVHIMNNSMFVLKFMNLKGPQAETVSYFAFPYYKFDKQYLNILVDSFERWIKDNRKDSKKTLWKMFEGRNFWDSEEILNFLGVNITSYYSFLLNFFDLAHKINDSYLLPKSEDDEDFLSDYYTELKMLKEYFENMEKDKKLSRNQDMLLTMHKFSNANSLFFQNKFEALSENENYDPDNYKFKIDSLNKENNCIYKYVPGYRNNFLKHTDVKAFEEYEDINYFKTKLLSILILNSIDDIPTLKTYSEQYSKFATEANIPVDILIAELYKKVVEHCENMDVDKFINSLDSILEILKKIKENLMDSLLTKAKSLKFGGYKGIKDFCYSFYEIKHFYLIQLGSIVSKFVKTILENKKAAAKYKTVKEKFNDGFKSPFINSLKEIEKILEDLLAHIHQENANEIEEELKTVNEQFKTHFNEKETQIMKDELGKLDEFHKEKFKEIKDYCKKLEDFIKYRF